MEFDSPLTLIGAIATILSMAFALAALLNSHRKHAQKAALAHQAAQTANAPPFPSIGKVIEQRLAGNQQLSAKESATTEKRTASVFKQVGPQGSEVTPSQHYDENEYIWE
jgi:hypothetical protein